MKIDYTDVPGMSDAIHRAIAVNDSAIWQLESLAGAFAKTGNNFVADNLYAIAEGLSEPPRLVQLAHTRDVQGQIRHGEAMVSGMLLLASRGQLRPAQGTEARSAETEGLGPTDDGPFGEADAPALCPLPVRRTPSHE